MLCSVVVLSFPLASSATASMYYLELRFERLDLLAQDTTCEKVVFLEMNPNGQWVWLDIDQTKGMFDAVIEVLIPGQTRMVTMHTDAIWGIAFWH